jgi:hypothetical protein
VFVCPKSVCSNTTFSSRIQTLLQADADAYAALSARSASGVAGEESFGSVLMRKDVPRMFYEELGEFQKLIKVANNTPILIFLGRFSFLSG